MTIRQPTRSTPVLIQRDPQRGYRLHTEMTIDLPRQTVFEFFSDAMQLERITPPWLHFSVLTPPPIQIQEGTLLDYRIRLHGIPMTWRTEICVWDAPHRFVDQQLKGPYRKWYHEHTFEEVQTEFGLQTVVHDDVHYVPPLGSIVNRFFVEPDLKKIFNYRQETLAKIFDDQIKEIGQKADGVSTV